MRPPLEAEILVKYQSLPTVQKTGELITLLTQLVEVGFVHRKLPEDFQDEG